MKRRQHWGLFALLAAAASLSACSRTRDTGESAGQVVARVEATYGFKVPTNTTVLHHAVWVKSIPRSQDVRMNLVHCSMDTNSWGALQEFLMQRNGWPERMKGPVPTDGLTQDYEYKAPWMNIVGAGWTHLFIRIDSKDPDGWKHDNRLSAYANSAATGTNVEVVFVSHGNRSQRSW